MKYTTITKGSQYTYWNRRVFDDFVPNDRQQMLMDVYNEAKQAGLFYTVDVLKFALERLEVTPEVAAIGADRVEGGDFGMDMYYARDAVDCANARASRKADLALIAPAIGMKLGSLMINYKRTNACVVSFLDGMYITIDCKRGAKLVRFYVSSTQLKNALENAYRKGWRKSATV